MDWATTQRKAAESIRSEEALSDSPTFPSLSGSFSRAPLQLTPQALASSCSFDLQPFPNNEIITGDSGDHGGDHLGRYFSGAIVHS